MTHFEAAADTATVKGNSYYAQPQVGKFISLKQRDMDNVKEADHTTAKKQSAIVYCTAVKVNKRKIDKAKLI